MTAAHLKIVTAPGPSTTPTQTLNFQHAANISTHQILNQLFSCTPPPSATEVPAQWLPSWAWPVSRCPRNQRPPPAPLATEPMVPTGRPALWRARAWFLGRTWVPTGGIASSYRYMNNWKWHLLCLETNLPTPIWPGRCLFTGGCVIISFNVSGQFSAQSKSFVLGPCVKLFSSAIGMAKYACMLSSDTRGDGGCKRPAEDFHGRFALLQTFWLWNGSWLMDWGMPGPSFYYQFCSSHHVSSTSVFTKEKALIWW